MRKDKTTALCTGLVVFCLFLSLHNVHSQEPTIRWADSCVSTSFYGKIFNGAGRSYLPYVNAYAGGDIIAFGEITDPRLGSDRSKQYGLVLRMTSTGQVVWSRFVGYFGNDNAIPSHRTSVIASTITNNGDIVFAAFNTDGWEPEGNVIIRMDGNGSVIWKKRIRNADLNWQVEDIIQTSDGGFLIGENGLDANIHKLDAAGNLQWQRRFTGFTAVNCRSVVESPSAYYFTGYNDVFGAGSRDVLVKMDKRSGDPVWIRSFNESPATQEKAEYVFDKMTYKNGLLTLIGGTGNAYMGPNRSAQAVISFDENGSVVSTKRIENSSVSISTSWVQVGQKFDPYSGTGVQYGYVNNNTISDAHVYRLNPDNTVQWAWQLVMSDLDAVNESVVMPDSSVVAVGVNRIPYDVMDGIIIKTSPAGKLDNCTSQPFQLKITSPDIPARPFTLGTSLNLTDSTRATIMEVVPGFGFSFQLLCFSGCVLSKIMGPSAVCTGGSYTYQVSKNGNCKGPVRFNITGGVTLQNTSDTSVSITFTSGGRFVLYASLEADCRVLKDSLVIQVDQGATPVSLGPDLTLCWGNSVRLNAHKGFASYLWQNGSTDSTYTVTQPGGYYVTVTDVCNHVFSDTVLVTGVGSITLDIGPNRSKCNDDTLHLSAPAGFLNYAWGNDYNINSPTAQNVVVNPKVDTAYYLKAEKMPGCFAYDTVRITVHHSPSIDLGADQSFCKGDSALFNAGGGFDQYLWSTGAATRQITVNSAGRYSVVGITAEGCKSYDTVRVLTVFVSPEVRLDHSTALCAGETRLLDAGSFSAYQWNDGSTARTFPVTEIGRYAVEVTDNNGCKGSDTAIITTLLSSPSGFLSADTAICPNEALTLKPINQYPAYLWNNNASAASLTISRAGIYWLQVKDDNNCTGRDTIVVGLKECQQGFYTPTAFTPNSDGKNDLFRPKIYGNVKQYQLIIYNRWGEVIFQTTDLQKGWDGTLKGNLQGSSVFIWTCRYQLEGESLKQQKGTVLLVR